MGNGDSDVLKPWKALRIPRCPHLSVMDGGRRRRHRTRGDPDRYTGRGEDVSPDFELTGIADEAVSIAIVMDDLDVPWSSNYTHWVIWNIPATSSIPEAIPHGAIVSSLSDAVKGDAFGTNKYRGPNPPFGTHRYQFHIFVLDDMLDLSSSAAKADLLAAMDGHIIQYGSITGWYPEAK